MRFNMQFQPTTHRILLSKSEPEGIPISYTSTRPAKSRFFSKLLYNSILQFKQTLDKIEFYRSCAYTAMQSPANEIYASFSRFHNTLTAGSNFSVHAVVSGMFLRDFFRALLSKTQFSFRNTTKY
jgi:hypothetical protein